MTECVPYHWFTCSIFQFAIISPTPSDIIQERDAAAMMLNDTVKLPVKSKKKPAKIVLKSS